MGRIPKMPPRPPCPPHKWIPLEESDSPLVAHIWQYAQYICEVCSDFWPDPRQKNPREAKPARY